MIMIYWLRKLKVPLRDVRKMSIYYYFVIISFEMNVCTPRASQFQQTVTPARVHSKTLVIIKNNDNNNINVVVQIRIILFSHSSKPIVIKIRNNNTTYTKIEWSLIFFINYLCISKNNFSILKIHRMRIILLLRCVWTLLLFFHRIFLISNNCCFTVIRERWTRDRSQRH